MKKNTKYGLACLLVCIGVSAAPAYSDPKEERTIEWKVENVPAGLDACMAVLIQGKPDQPATIPFVVGSGLYGMDKQLGGGGQIDGISFLGDLKHTVTIDITTWGAPHGLEVLNWTYWSAAKEKGYAQDSGEGGQGEEIDFVPYYLLIFNSDATINATAYAVVEWEYNPGKEIDFSDGGHPEGNPYGFQCITFDLGALNWVPITFTSESVPEPASLSLLGLGAAAMIARRRK